MNIATFYFNFTILSHTKLNNKESTLNVLILKNQILFLGTYLVYNDCNVLEDP